MHYTVCACETTQFFLFQWVGKSQRIELPWQQGGQRFESSPSPLFLKHGWQSGRMHRFCNPVFHIVGSNPMPCAILLKFMPVLNSIGRVAAQRTYNEHASKQSPGGGMPLYKACDSLWLRTRNAYTGLLFQVYIIWVRRLEAEGDRLLTDYS